MALPLPAAFAEEEPVTVLDAGELQALVEEFLSAERMDPKLVSIGFLYAETGEEWYYNADQWYYSASLYKVPLTMLVANMVARGELEQTDRLYGTPLTVSEELILRHSSNDHAHLLMNWFWPKNRECRELWPALAGMEGEDFPQSFYLQSYFSAPFITRVFDTLCRDPDSYPMVTDYLLLAQPGEYLRRELGDGVPIAQKYGSYEQFGHVSGIIFRDRPIVVTLLTQCTTRVSERSGKLAALLCDYADTLDARLDERWEAIRLQATEEEARREEEARQAEEERRRAAQAAQEAVREAAAEEPAEAPPERTGTLPAAPIAAAAAITAALTGGLVLARRKRKQAGEKSL